MLRNATSRAAVRRSRLLVSQAPTQARRVPDGAVGNSQASFRSFATSDKKRALNAQQLKGSAAKEPKKTSIPPPEAAGSVEAEKSSSLSPVMALLVATGGAGAAYYSGLLDGQLGDKYKSKNTVAKDEAPPKKVAKKEAKPAEAPAKKETPKASPDKVDKSLAKAAKEEVVLSQNEIETFNEIITDVIGEASMEVEGVQEVVAAIAEEEKKNAAAVQEAAKAAKKAAKKAAALAKKEKETEPVVEEDPLPSALGSTTIATSTLDEAKIMAEIEELKKQLNEKASSALQEAHTELAKLGSMDVMGTDLDKMTPSQLKVRLVQMARDLEERTKWEAVRLQEFLAMKEKEVEDRYAYFCFSFSVKSFRLRFLTMLKIPHFVTIELFVPFLIDMFSLSKSSDSRRSNSKKRNWQSRKRFSLHRLKKL